MRAVFKPGNFFSSAFGLHNLCQTMLSSAQAQALESDMPVDKEVDEEAAWSAAPLGAQDIAGAKAVPTTA